MAGAAWLSVAGAVVFAALTLFYLVRLLVCGRGVDASRAVMSLGMTAMLVPNLDPLPRLVWQVIFALAGAHVAAVLIRRAGAPAPDGHHELHLVIGAAAMVYMLAVMPADHDMAAGQAMGPTGVAIPVLSWALAAYFLIFAVWLCARLAVPVAAGEAMSPRAVLASAHLVGSTEVVMGVGMGCMLIITL